MRVSFSIKIMSVVQRIYVIFSDKNKYNLLNYKMEYFLSSGIMLHFVNIVYCLSQYCLILIHIVERTTIAYPLLAYSAALKATTLK